MSEEKDIVNDNFINMFNNKTCLNEKVEEVKEPVEEAKEPKVVEEIKVVEETTKPVEETKEPKPAKRSEHSMDPALEYKITENERSKYNKPSKAKFNSVEEELEWARNQSKDCNKCKKSLPLSYFGGNTSSSDSFDKNGYRLRRGDCIKCNKEHNKGKNEAKKIAKSQGISFKAEEGTKCELCQSEKSIVFDHNHETNTFRGWLCDPCNRSMGVLGDNVTGLIKCINYMNKLEKKELKIENNILST